MRSHCTAQLTFAWIIYLSKMSWTVTLLKGYLVEYDLNKTTALTATES